MLAKVTWENDWPVFSIDPTMDIPVSGQESKSIVVSDEFYNGTEKAPYLNKESDAADTAETVEAAAYSLAAEPAAASAPETREAEMEELIVNGGFESSTDGWEMRTFNGSASMEVTSEDKASGESSLLVYDKNKYDVRPHAGSDGKSAAGTEASYQRQGEIYHRSRHQKV